MAALTAENVAWPSRCRSPGSNPKGQVTTGGGDTGPTDSAGRTSATWAAPTPSRPGPRRNPPKRHLPDLDLIEFCTKSSSVDRRGIGTRPFADLHGRGGGVSVGADELRSCIKYPLPRLCSPDMASGARHRVFLEWSINEAKASVSHPHDEFESREYPCFEKSRS